MIQHVTFEIARDAAAWSIAAWPSTVSSPSSVWTTLREGGYDPEPRCEHWGSPRSYVRAPAGNLVEMMAFPPAVATARIGY